MLELTKLPKRFEESLGRDRMAELLGVKPAILAMWLAKDNLPIEHLETLLKHDPSPLQEVQPLYTNPPEGTKLAILMPYTHGPEPDTMESILRLYDPKEMTFHRRGFNNLSVARNSLAAQWLAGPCEWAFWSDADMVHPCGNVPFFRRATGLPNYSEVFAGVHTIYRLLVHQKPFVSVWYPGRAVGGGLQFAGGNDPLLRNNFRNGPRDGTLERDWCGFGGVLLHRRVLETIIAEQGSEIDVHDSYVHKTFGYRYAFFSPTNNETPGDDIPFCARAGRAGFKPLIDLAVFSGHTGTKTYTFQDL